MLHIWKKLLTASVATTGPVAEAEQREAVAVLLLEVAQADFDLAEAELAQLRRSLARHWELSESELDELLRRARQVSRQTASLHGPIRVINETCSAEEKLGLVRSLWQVAYADDELDPHEEHLVRRLADMLHVPHRHFVALKHRVQPGSAGGDSG